MNKVKCYFKNLFFAFLGRNPVREELENVRKAYERNEENVIILNRLYSTCLGKMDEAGKQIISLQALVEILRQHLAEKEKMLEEQGAYRRN